MKAQSAAERRDTTLAHALWYVAPRVVRIDAERLGAPTQGDLLVASAFSAISRGTERLVYGGLTDPGHRDGMRSPMQVGDFPFPVKYGYCSVGRVEEGPADFLGRTVFALHPHQDRFRVASSDVMLIPEGVSARRATLAANMETALNALWDSGAGAGDRIVIVGAGVVGLLITYLAARLPGAEVTALDTNPRRRALVESFGAAYAERSDQVAEADVVFHTSASAKGLASAIDCCAAEATLAEVSWYGDASVEVSLGGPFHSKRLRLISSQVGEVPPGRRPRWTLRRRLAKALDLLKDDRLDALITHEVPFAKVPESMAAILDGRTDAVSTIIRYS